MRKSDQAHVVTLNQPSLLILTKIAPLLPGKGHDDFIFANRQGGLMS